MLSRLKNKLTRYLDHVIEKSLKLYQQESAPNYFNSASFTQAMLVNMYNEMRLRVKEGKPLPDITDSGFSIYSQFDEDGIMLYVFGVIGFTSRKFVDIGGGDGLFGNNSANLINNFGFHGLFIDYNEDANRMGEEYYSKKMSTFLYPPKFVIAKVNRDNINSLIKDSGCEGEVDLLSIDIDGNDYWIWDAINVISPRVVVVETHVEFGMNNIVVPYDADYFYPGEHPDYHGASPVAMAKMAKRKGYRLVGNNRYGFNTFYVRNDIAPGLLPEIPVEQVLKHERNKERAKLFEYIKNKKYVTVDQ